MIDTFFVLLGFRAIIVLFLGCLSEGVALGCEDFLLETYFLVVGALMVGSFVPVEALKEAGLCMTLALAEETFLEMRDLADGAFTFNKGFFAAGVAF